MSAVFAAEDAAVDPQVKVPAPQGHQNSAEQADAQAPRVSLLRRIELALFKARPQPEPGLAGLGYADQAGPADVAAKLKVFETLMRYRGQADHPELACAMNVIDLLFIDDELVRSAYRTYWTASQTTGFPRVRRELMIELIAAVVLHLGLAGKIGVEDIEREAQPRAQGRLGAVLDDLERRVGVTAAAPRLKLVA